MAGEQEKCAQNPSRRAIFKAAPAIAAASAVSVPPAAIAGPIEETFIDRAYRDYRETRSAIMKAQAADHDVKNWQELCSSAQSARARLCQEQVLNENDFWLQVSAALETCGGVAGALDSMEGEIERGVTYGHTMALAVLVNLVQLRSKLVI